MSDEIFLEGKTYVSSKRASAETGYAQDYIGQLARKGLVEAQRVGGLWYVTVSSLSSYQRNAASYAPQAPIARPQKEIDSVITFDGKDYISASRAAKLTGYNQDYIGQLARSGKVLSRQIGNRWYVDRDMLLTHKAQKDAMLAAVQAESVGVMRSQTHLNAQGDAFARDDAGPMLTYIAESDRDLMPVLTSPKAKDSSDSMTAATPLVIRKVSPIRAQNVTAQGVKAPEIIHERRVRRSGKTMHRAIIAGVALTFVIMLSYGWEDLRRYSSYTFNAAPGSSAISSSALAASAAEAAEKFMAFVEELIVPQLQYRR